ncbi:MAG: acetyl-CoA carboxylase carboxyltransferase subunit alpha [Candidatus Firestonebacteria bacterium]|nr:acetyl-CoA carboxylase carboxyltransferase subunit alpha [Candidatus Firestonebacteria bacterium]
MVNSKVFDLNDSFEKSFEGINNDKLISSDAEIIREKTLEGIRKKIHLELAPWERIQIARHPERPYTMDYIKLLTKDFIEFHGDREFSDDLAIVGGITKFKDMSVMIIGHQKGRNTKENILRNFGMPHPEGFRKALRLMQMAEKFKIPIITFVDTPGAYPGIGAEERGQGRAIAYNLYVMSQLRVPIISVVIGEGASGGALAIGIADRTLMLENSYYSVISPEGCAAILWKDKTKSSDAAQSLKLTAEDLYKFGVIDDIIPEPDGGAHKDFKKTAENMESYLVKYLNELAELPANRLLQSRYEHYRQIGSFIENA